MTVVPPDYELKGADNTNPVLWIEPSPISEFDASSRVDTSDAVIDRYLGEGNNFAIKSFGHDPITGVHFLLTRKGTTLHTDKAYLRYTHQLVLRNDGNRLRGLAKYDSPNPSDWHPMMVPGMMYVLDAHSPHQGWPDTRFPDRPNSRGTKVVIAVDRDRPLSPPEAWALLSTYLDKQMADFPFDPNAKFLKWKPPVNKPIGWK